MPPTNDELQRNVRRRLVKANALRMYLVKAVKWHERWLLTGAIMVGVFLSLKKALRLYGFVCRVLAKNPDHRIAVEVTRMMEGKASDS